MLKLYPFKVFYACVVPANGAHPEAVANIALFINEVGLVHFSYISDREPAIKTFLEETCKVAG